MHHTREIPREGWFEYLSLLSSVERDHWVRIEAEGPDIRSGHAMANSLPLVDIALEEKGSDRGAIEVTVGRPGEEVTHRVLQPEHIYAGENESGDVECLDIEDAAHVKMTIYFEPQAQFEEALPQQAQ